MGDSTSERRLALYQQLELEVQRQIRNRTHSGDDLLSGAGERLQAPDTNSLAQTSAALVPGKRYLFTYDDGVGGAVPGNPCYVVFDNAAAPVGATNAGLLIYHGERRYFRIPESGDNAVSVLFPDTASFATLIRSDERSES